jgi:hypothetical protein
LVGAPIVEEGSRLAEDAQVLDVPQEDRVVACTQPTRRPVAMVLLNVPTLEGCLAYSFVAESDIPEAIRRLGRALERAVR